MRLRFTHRSLLVCVGQESVHSNLAVLQVIHVYPECTCVPVARAEATLCVVATRVLLSHREKHTEDAR